MEIQKLGTKYVLVMPDGKRLKSGDDLTIVRQINSMGIKITSGLDSLPAVCQGLIRKELKQ